MVHTFLFSCFLLGLIAASPGGPICMLVFNRSIRSGFWAGVFTGIGAACADAAYAGLGLAGVLSALRAHQEYTPWLYGVGGVVLCAVGASLLTRKVSPPTKTMNVSRYSSMLIQGFMLTILNPLVALFFMTAGMQFLSSHEIVLTPHIIFWAAGTVGIGSALVFTIASLLGKLLGRGSASSLRVTIVQRLTGLVLVGIGAVMLLSALGFVRF